MSYTAAAALTGVPFMVAPLSSLGSAVLSQVIGKRPIHLGATLLMLAGTVWNMHVAGSYLQFMFARLFQGVGWGAFDGIVMISIRDIFYVCPTHLKSDEKLTKYSLMSCHCASTLSL